MGLNILLVDDDSSVLNVFKAALNPVIKIQYCEDINQAKEKIKSTNYDLIIFDLYFDKENSLTFLSELKIQKPDILKKILIMSGQGDLDDEIESHQLGIREYLKKPLNIKLIKAVIEKHIYCLSDESANIKSIGPFSLNLDVHQVTLLDKNNNPNVLDLTLKEFQILKYLLDNPGRVLSREKIMQKVWNYENETLTRTVDMHISALRKKIDPHSHLIETRRGIGYIFNN